MLPSCRKRSGRRLASLARKHGARFVGLFLTADLATRLARIEQRKNDASDATRDVVLMQETFAIGAVDWHMVDASGTPDQSLRSARVLLLEPAPTRLTMASNIRTPASKR